MQLFTTYGRIFLQSLPVLLLVLHISAPIATGQTTTFEAQLLGMHEVQPVASPATGSALAVLDGDSLIVTGSFSGLTSDMRMVQGTPSHIHLAAAGANGPISVLLDVTADENLRGGQFEAANNRFLLTADQQLALLEGRFYINVHTDAFPGGEIRGQLLASPNEPPTAVSLTSPADGAQVTVKNRTDLHFTTTWEAATDPDEDRVVYVWQVGFDQAFNFVVLTRSTATAQEFTVDLATIDALLAQAGVQTGQSMTLYHRVLSSDGSAFTAGPARSVVLSRAATTEFAAQLRGHHEVQPVMTEAEGSVQAVLDGDTLVVQGSFSGLTSAMRQPPGHAHIHIAAAGVNGPVVFPLDVTTDASRLSGTFEAANNRIHLTTEQQQVLHEGRYYVNVHSENYPGGEIRGQLLLSPNNPPIAPELTAPEAGAQFMVRNRSDLDFVVTWDEATDPDGDHVVYIWQIAADAEFDTVLLSRSTGTGTEFRTDFATIDALMASAGITTGFEIALHHRVLASDGSITTASEGRTVLLTRAETTGFSAHLMGLHEAPPVMTEAAGEASAVLDGDTLVVSGSFSGLSSPMRQPPGHAHIHVAPAGASGGVVFPLSVEVEEGRLAGVLLASENRIHLTAEQRETLLAGEYYVNIHSDNYPGGEIRGQLLVAPNEPPGQATILEPASGAVVGIDGTTESELTARWSSATDPDGDRVVYYWQVAADAEFQMTLLTMAAVTDTLLSTNHAAIAMLMASLGVQAGGSVTLHHRVISSDGSLTTDGEAAVVTLTLGEVVSTRDDPALPERFSVHGNYPNPFNPVTTIRFDLPASARVSLEVYDILGQRVLEIPQRTMDAGSERTIQVDAHTLSSGIYFYRVVAEMGDAMKMEGGRMVLVK